MKKQLFLIGILWLNFTSFGQTKNITTKKPLTSKYAGSYSYGTTVEKGSVGFIIIYPETDNTILFYIDLNYGAPSYSMGSLYGRVKIENGNGLFYTNFGYSDIGCKLKFQFSKNQLKIDTIEDDCGFGHSVFADGTFKQKTNKTQEYFEDNEMTKVYFKKTKPTDYYKE